MAEKIDNVSHVNAEELKSLLEDAGRSAVVIDVREPEEYEQAHIEGLPLIPMGEIAPWTEKLDPEKEYVFVCRSGRRSFEVAKYFQNSGFSRVHNFSGGMLNWIEQGNPIAAGPAEPIERFGLEK